MTIVPMLAAVVPLPTKASVVDAAMQELILELQTLLESGDLLGLVVIGEMKQGDSTITHRWQTITDHYRAIGLIERAKQLALAELDDAENGGE